MQELDTITKYAADGKLILLAASLQHEVCREVAYTPHGIFGAFTYALMTVVVKRSKSPTGVLSIRYK